jgi:hypothetical protein
VAKDTRVLQGLVCGRNAQARPDPLTQHCRAPDYWCRPVRHVVDLHHHWHLNSHFIKRKNIMKTPNKSKNQSGFFDLGISLLILVIAGGSVYFSEKAHTEKTVAHPEGTTLDNKLDETI